MAHQGSGATGYATSRRHVASGYARSGVKPAAAAALALHASSNSATLSGSAVTTVTSAPFSPPAGSVIVVAVAILAQGAATGTVTSTGTALTWALLRRDNGGGFGMAEVWWAYNASAQSGITVTDTFSPATFASAGSWGLMRTLVFTGAAAAQAGATAIRNNSATATPSLSVTTAKAGSWVWGVVADQSDASAITPGAAQALDASVVNAGGPDQWWTQKQNAVTPAAGTAVTVNVTSPTNVRHNMVAFEVEAA
jgi:hypothetical protein